MRENLKHLLIVALGTAGMVVGLSTASLAHGGGGGMSGGAGAGMGASGNMEMGAGNVNAGTTSGVNGNFGGDSSSHISAEGTANTDGPNAADRDTGYANAKTRMSAQGSAHNKAGKHQKSAADADTDDTTSTSAATGSTPQ
jgi:hypothetical protein